MRENEQKDKFPGVVSHQELHRISQWLLAQRWLCASHSFLFQMQESSYLILVLLLSVEWGYRNFHISSESFCTLSLMLWLGEIWGFFFFFEDFLPWRWGECILCMKRRIQILIASRTAQTTLISILGSAISGSFIFIRQNFQVPLCFSEAMWLPGQWDMRGNNTGHFPVTAFNFWCKTSETSGFPTLMILEACPQDGAWSDQDRVPYQSLLDI